MATIAVDFDGTLCEHKFPEIGEIRREHLKVIQYIRARQQAGDIIILWTCRENVPDRKYLDEAVAWCKRNGIPLNYINDNPSNPFGNTNRKIYADLYIDDKAVNVHAFMEVEG